MKPRATLAVVLVAAALGTFYWYWEVKTKPARDQALEDAKLVFPGMKSDGTGELLIRAGTKPDVNLRKVDGVWRLVAPVQALADAQAVDALLDQLKSVKHDEVVEDKASDLHKYGLDQPSGAVTFKSLSAGTQAGVLFFGADSFDGSKAYGMVDGQSSVFLTSLAAKTALLKDADGLRDKRLLIFDPGDVESLRSTQGAGFLIDRDKQGQWQVHSGSQLEPARVDAVNNWIAALQGIKGSSVVEETVKNPAKYGLGKGLVELGLKGQAKLALQKGSLQGKGPAFYGRVQGQSQVWLLPSSASAILSKDGHALMDLQAFDFQAGLVERFAVWQGGTTLTARRDKDFKWSWDPPQAAKPGVAPFNFEDFIAKVGGSDRLSRLKDSARPTKPLMVVTFYGAQDAFLDQALVGPKQGAGQVAQSAMKKMVMLVPGNLFDSLPPPPAKK
jgi:hypothetical protein